MSVARHLLGVRGESIAEEWLVMNGWSVLNRRFRSGHRDIDLVVSQHQNGRSGRTVAFVEVKTRLSREFGGPLGAVHWRKQRELARAAREWMGRFREAGDAYRFDVIGVTFAAGAAQVTHVENAFLVR
ncbi:MAG TPA: YraN family protein [Gemmatimonadaceae bacterium]